MIGTMEIILFGYNCFQSLTDTRDVFHDKERLKSLPSNGLVGTLRDDLVIA